MTVQFHSRLFSEVVFFTLLARYCDYCSKRFHENFGINTKRCLESSDESTATPCPRTFDRTHTAKGQLSVSDEWKKLPKTAFETT